MRIKTKLTLGVGLLFALIVVLVVISTIYLDALSSDTKKILAANYNTLEYSQNILMTIDGNLEKNQAVAIIEDNLNKQLHNITEQGEHEITMQLSEHCNRYKYNLSDSTIQSSIRNDVYALMKINTNL